MKLKKDPIDDELLILAAAQLRDYRLLQYEVLKKQHESLPYSMQERLSKSYAENEKIRKIKRAFQTLISCLLALSLAGGAAAYGNPDLRELFGGWIRNIYLKKAAYLFHNEQQSPFELAYFEVECFVPDGYELDWQVSQKGFLDTVFKYGKGSVFSIRISDYRFSNNFYVEDDGELNLSEGIINGNRYEYYQGTFENPHNILIVWNDSEQYVVIIGSELEKEDLFKIYTNTSIKRK